MKRLIIVTIVVGGILLAARKLAQRADPVMWERCSEMCDRMLANMPDSFPPNRMMADLEALKEQTARILDALESQTDDKTPDQDPQPNRPQSSGA